VVKVEGVAGGEGVGFGGIEYPPATLL